MSAAKAVKVTAGHYRLGEFEIVVEQGGHAGEGNVWWVYRGPAFASPVICSAVSLGDAKAAVTNGTVARIAAGKGL